MSVPEEHVLVVPAAVIDSIGPLDGFENDSEKFLGPILSSDQLSYRPRSEMETDPRFKQLIPYVILQWTDESGAIQIFAYTRGGGGGEQRLHAKRSVGIGGHISQEDSGGGHADAYKKGMQRELSEEINLDTAYTESTEGLIYDSASEVGRVHLGVVHRFVLETPDVSSNEADLAEGGFHSLDALFAEPDRLETWSRLALEGLYRR